MGSVLPVAPLRWYPLLMVHDGPSRWPETTLGRQPASLTAASHLDSVDINNNRRQIALMSRGGRRHGQAGRRCRPKATTGGGHDCAGSCRVPLPVPEGVVSGFRQETPLSHSKTLVGVCRARSPTTSVGCRARGFDARAYLSALVALHEHSGSANGGTLCRRTPR